MHSEVWANSSFMLENFFGLQVGWAYQAAFQELYLALLYLFWLKGGFHS